MDHADTAVSKRLRGGAGRCLVVLAGAGLFVLSLTLLRQSLGPRLRFEPRYGLAFSDLTCQPPPPLKADVFLAEVQYLSGLPDRLSVLDPDLPRRLAGAFARHPWVERVERVELAAPRRASVRLVYRQAVLAVANGRELRAVDRHGVLLPAGAATAGLPVYPRRADPPVGEAGERWGDPAVESAARHAAGLP